MFVSDYPETVMMLEGVAMKISITTIRERTDLLSVIARWLWDEWYRADGMTLSEAMALYEPGLSDGLPQTFVLLEGEAVIGTASLSLQDLRERPELTPWLAGVYIAPRRRGHGYVYPLIAAVEHRCRSASIKTLWLHTNTAEQVYRRAGWETVEYVNRQDRLPTTLMRRSIPNRPLPLRC
jgi:N-acetylglutamate synthase-like GNAT family acetyltransferase